MKKAMLLITFAVLLYLGVRNLDIVFRYAGAAWTLVFPFVLGGAIAFILNVPMRGIEKGMFRLQKKIMPKSGKRWEKLVRPVSMILSMLLVVFIILVVALVVIPELATTVGSVARKIEANIPVFQRWIEDTFRDDSPMVEWANNIDIHPEEILDTAAAVLKNGVNSILSSTISVTMGIVNTFMNLGIGLIFAIYILLQKEKLAVQCKKALYAMLPGNVVEYLLHVCSLSSRTFGNFVAGQCIEAVILGGMFFVVMTLFRFPYAMLVGVLIAFTALIPVFGAFIGCAVGFFLILMVSPVKALAFLVVFFVLQQLEGNLIYPHVVGNSVGLPSIWVLAAVTIGGSLMGVVGMLVFIPLVSVMYALFREWVYGRLKKKGLKIS